MKICNIGKIITAKIDGTNLTRDNYISTENMLSNCGGVVASSSVPSTKVTRFSKHDVLLSNIRPYFKKVWFARFDGGCSNDVICIRANEKDCLSQYLYYAISTDSFIDSFSASSKGTKMPRGDKNALLSYEIPDRTIDEQQHIVDILGTLDDKIENLEEVNSKIQSYCIAKYRLLFSNVERIPLSNIAAITMGQSPAGNTLNEKDGVIFYQGRTDFGFRYPTVRLFTTDPKRMANTGDILLSVRAPVGDVNIAAEDCCIGRGIAAISSEYNSFVYYSILNQKSDFDIYNNSGTIFGSINRDALSAFKIPAANIALIEKFESVASELDKVIHNNTLKIYKLRALKQLYLHKFFG